MKKLFLLICFTTFGYPLFAQQRAVTETGEEVILYVDGRWDYVNKDSIEITSIPTNSQPFEKNKKSSFLLKSTRMEIGCYLDPKKWTFNQAPPSDPAEFEIDNKELGLYALILTERLKISLEGLANIALENARDAAPDIKVVHKEYRNVNGLNVLMMHMTGTIADILFSYYGYYYTTDTASVQFLVYSSKENIDENITVVEELLNGLVEPK